MSEKKDEGPLDKLTRETYEKSPAEAVRDDLAGGQEKEAHRTSEAEREDVERELSGDESAGEAAEKHWKADS